MKRPIPFVFFCTQAACPNGKISKADTVSFLRSINSGKEDQIEKQAADIHKAFDANNDGIVGKYTMIILIRKISFLFVLRSTRIFNRLCFDFNGQCSRKIEICFSYL